MIGWLIINFLKESFLVVAKIMLTCSGLSVRANHVVNNNRTFQQNEIGMGNLLDPHFFTDRGAQAVCETN